jgi:hypothetical protein
VPALDDAPLLGHLPYNVARLEMTSNVVAGFHRMLRRVGLPEHLTPHVCRHTAAANMLHAGVNPVEVSSILGHTDPSITMKVYAAARQRVGRLAWTPPPGLASLEVLAAWYARPGDGFGEDAEDTEDIGDAQHPVNQRAAGGKLPRALSRGGGLGSSAG